MWHVNEAPRKNGEFVKKGLINDDNNAKELHEH